MKTGPRKMTSTRRQRGPVALGIVLQPPVSSMGQEFWTPRTGGLIIIRQPSEVIWRVQAGGQRVLLPEVIRGMPGGLSRVRISLLQARPCKELKR